MNIAVLYDQVMRRALAEVVSTGQNGSARTLNCSKA